MYEQKSNWSNKIIAYYPHTPSVFHKQQYALFLQFPPADRQGVDISRVFRPRVDPGGGLGGVRGEHGAEASRHSTSCQPTKRLGQKWICTDSHNVRGGATQNSQIGIDGYPAKPQEIAKKLQINKIRHDIQHSRIDRDEDEWERNLASDPDPHNSHWQRCPSWRGDQSCRWGQLHFKIDASSWFQW